MTGWNIRSPDRGTAPFSVDTVDGALWAARDEAVRQQAFDHIAATSVLTRPVTEAEVAAAVVHLLLNTGATGSVHYLDGGYSLR